MVVPEQTPPSTLSHLPHLPLSPLKSTLCSVRFWMWLSGSPSTSPALSPPVKVTVHMRLG